MAYYHVTLKTLLKILPYPAIHQRCHRQVVKQVGKVLPHIRVAVLAKTLVIEPVHLSDLSRLMVPSQDGHSARIANLQDQ